MHSAGSEESKSNSTSFPASSGPSSARHARFGAGDTDDAAAPAGPPCLLPIPLAAQFAHTAVHRLHGSGHGGVSQGQAAGGGMELWLTPHSRRTTGGRDSTDASHGARSRKSTPGQHDRGSGAQTEDLTAAALGAYSVRVSGDAIGPDTDSTSGDSCVVVSAVLTLCSESPPHAARLCVFVVCLVATRVQLRERHKRRGRGHHDHSQRPQRGRRHRHACRHRWPQPCAEPEQSRRRAPQRHVPLYRRHPPL